MAIKPILFNIEMVRAILDGKKTCTRRIVKGAIPDDAMWRTMPCLNSCIRSIRKDIFVQQTAGKVQGLLG